MLQAFDSRSLKVAYLHASLVNVNSHVHFGCCLIGIIGTANVKLRKGLFQDYILHFLFQPGQQRVNILTQVETFLLAWVFSLHILFGFFFFAFLDFFNL